jgi:histone H4
MSGRGKGGKGLGKGGAKRHRKVLRDNIQGITKPAIRRLARRGGTKRISGLIYEETRGTLKDFLQNTIKDAVIYTEHARRKTVTALDVVHALKRQGRTLCGFGGGNKEYVEEYVNRILSMKWEDLEFLPSAKVAIVNMIMKKVIPLISADNDEATHDCASIEVSMAGGGSRQVKLDNHGRLAYQNGKISEYFALDGKSGKDWMETYKTTIVDTIGPNRRINASITKIGWEDFLRLGNVMIHLSAGFIEPIQLTTPGLVIANGVRDSLATTNIEGFTLPEGINMVTSASKAAIIPALRDFFGTNSMITFGDSSGDHPVKTDEINAVLRIGANTRCPKGSGSMSKINDDGIDIRCTNPGSLVEVNKLITMINKAINSI